MSLKWQNYIFDCDGVILDSNELKGQAFYDIAAAYSREAAELFIEHHETHGGISRFTKFEYLFKDILKLPDPKPHVEKALAEFQSKTLAGLKICPFVQGIEDFLKSLPVTSNAYVVSASQEDDLVTTIHARGLSKYFKGVYGSPNSKNDNVLKHSLNKPQTVFFGDAKADFDCSTRFGFDFIMIHGYTGWHDWKAFENSQSNWRGSYKSFRELMNT